MGVRQPERFCEHGAAEILTRLTEKRPACTLLGYQRPDVPHKAGWVLFVFEAGKRERVNKYRSYAAAGTACLLKFFQSALPSKYMFVD
jgi:hypothetical protein